MADNNNGFRYGFVDIRRNNKGQQTTALGTQQSGANYNGVVNMRARLSAVNAGYYTTKRLDSMSENDMIYAVRLSDDLAGVK